MAPSPSFLARTTRGSGRAGPFAVAVPIYPCGGQGKPVDRRASADRAPIRLAEGETVDCDCGRFDRRRRPAPAPRNVRTVSQRWRMPNRTPPEKGGAPSPGSCTFSVASCEMRALTSAIRWKSRGGECVNTQLAAGRTLMAGLVAPSRTRPTPRSRASPRRSNARHSTSTLPARAPSRSVMLSVSSGSGIFARTGLVTVRTSARTASDAAGSSPLVELNEEPPSSPDHSEDTARHDDDMLNAHESSDLLRVDLPPRSDRSNKWRRCAQS